MDPLTRLVYSTTGGTKKTYLDEVFDTYLYRGDGNAGLTITTGIDLSGDGGMTWIKNRSTSSRQHVINDTVRGAGNNLFTDSNAANQVDTNKLSSFSSTGFTVGGDSYVNANGDDYASWNFRKAKGFFDIVTYTGTGSAHTKAHSLGCVPGCIIIKKTSAGANWRVYHRGVGATKGLKLNGNDAEFTSSGYWNDTLPTSTEFTIGTSGECNDNGATYVAYLFAGGASTAATARSVDFPGENSSEYLVPPSALIPAGNDSNKFCIECWINMDGQDGNDIIYSQYEGGNAGRMWLNCSGGRLEFWQAGSAVIQSAAYTISNGIWYHVAWTYDGTNHRLFLDGILQGMVAGAGRDALTPNNPRIGNINSGGYDFNGRISNFRVVHDQAVYTTSFTPSIEPLTTTSQGVTASNCKALCFNNTNILNNDGTLAALTNPDSGNITAKTDSPFDDLAGFAFGDSGDQNIIKCGSYRGDGNTEGPIFGLGWEPQWILIKSAGLSEGWFLADTMRGIVSDGDCMRLQPNTAGPETEGGNRFDVTPRGIKINSTDNEVNDNNTEYIYIAIRAFDPLVTTPISLGTEAFSMDTGNSSTVIPAFDSGWPVDFPLLRQPASSQNWFATPRIMGKYYVVTDTNDAQNDTSPSFDTDSNLGWAQNAGYGSNYQSWMWRRGPGFDVVAYTGTGADGRWIPHSLNAVPEMIWVKRRNTTGQWIVGHIGLDGGTDPWTHYMTLETTDVEADYPLFYDTPPTSLTFTVNGHNEVNGNGSEFISMLFTSVDGISKVGYYDGSDSEQTITTGFSPRFCIIRNISVVEDWSVFDTLRGWGAGNDKYLKLNATTAQSDYDFGAPTATGFTLLGNNSAINKGGQKFIYYAHA